MELTQEYFDSKLNTLVSKEYLDSKLENVVTKEYFEKRLDDRLDKLVTKDYFTKHLNEKIEELAIMVANGFEDMQNRLDVRERVSVLEHDMKNIKKSLLV